LAHPAVTSIIQRDALKYAYSFAMPLPNPAVALRPPVPKPSHVTNNTNANNNDSNNNNNNNNNTNSAVEAMKVEGHERLVRSHSRINPAEDLKALKPGAKLFKYQLDAVCISS
jgi:hypothetical protein